MVQTSPYTETESSRVNRSNRDILHPGEGCCTGSAGFFGGIICGIRRFLWDAMKYLFYVLVGVLFPSSFYRYFFKYGDYPWNNLYLLIEFLISAFCAVMAFWSHRLASPPADPGYLRWDHFRTARQLQDTADK